MVCVGRNWNRSKQINPNAPCLNLPGITSSSLDHLGAKRDITPPTLIITARLGEERLDCVITEELF